MKNCQAYTRQETYSPSQPCSKPQKYTVCLATGKRKKVCAHHAGEFMRKGEMAAEVMFSRRGNG